MKIVTALVIGAAAATAVVSLPALVLPAAAGGPAAAGPVLTVSREAQFAVGTQVVNETGLASLPDAYTGVDLLLRWSATDPTGICGYYLYREYVGAPEVRVLDNTTDTTYLARVDDYDNAQGGGSQSVAGFRVVARNCAGVTSSKRLGSQPVVVQDNGAYYVPESNSRPTGVKVSYAGSWTTQRSADYSRGTQHVTSTAGSTVTFTGTLVPGSQLALVTSSYGVGEVYVDGVRVSTTLGSDEPRTIVFDRLVGGGAHTVKVVASSRGLAIDAFLVS